MSYSLSPAQTVGEADGVVTFTVTRSASSSAETLYVSTSPTFGFSNSSDYVGLLNQVLTFAAGETQKTVSVTILDDSTIESNETFGIIVQQDPKDPATTYLAKSSFTIVDDDAPPPFQPVPLTIYPATGIDGIGQGNRDNDDSHVPDSPRQWSYDFLASSLTEVHAVEGGTVVAVRQNLTGSFRGNGNVVTILHDGGFYATYGHLTAFSSTLSVGDTVAAGDVIALSGASGTYDGSALHPNLHIQLGTSVSSINAKSGDSSTATLMADGSGDAIAPAYFPKLVIDFSDRADPGLSTDTDYYGTMGVDDFRGNGLANSVYGGGGNDILRGGGGADVLDGGDGIDTADYSDKTVSVVVTLNGSSNVTVKVGGSWEDTLRNIENVGGGTAGDTLTGDSLANLLMGREGNDILNGGAGDDTLRGGAGADTLDGGDGFDFADFSDQSAGIAVTLSGSQFASVKIGGVATDSIRNVENISGTNFADSVTGDSGRNLLNGGAGNDTLRGAAGNDVIRGGDGNDRIWGGAGPDNMSGGSGRDVFAYASLKDAGDVILDFTSGIDSFNFSAAGFGFAQAGQLPAGTLSIQADHVAADETVRFIFDTTDTSLWFDADGSGAGLAVLIADLQANATMKAGDILIV